MKKIKLSFRKEPRETGLAGVVNPVPPTQIKVDGKIIGSIIPPSYRDPEYLWKVSFMVMKSEPDGNPNCDWKHIYLKKKFSEESEAREHIKQIIDEIMKRYTFKYLEE